MEEYRIESCADWDGKRIDKVLSDYFDGYSRSFLKKMFDENLVKVNEQPCKASFRPKPGDLIDISIPEPENTEINAENIPLDILYEDDDIIIINKPKGMVVHPAPGHYTGTLVNGLMYHCGSTLSGINGQMRPGIVHRIDMDTTGVLVVCKNDAAHRSLSDQLSTHSITRKYYAIVYGVISDDCGTVDKPIGRSPRDRKKMAVNERSGRHAVTHFRVLARFRDFTYIECQLETGRTHQIRVHMASIGHPILGDSVYGPRNCPYKLQGQTLHAGVLGFIHPRTQEYVEFSAELPEYFRHLLELLRNKK